MFSIFRQKSIFAAENARKIYEERSKALKNLANTTQPGHVTEIENIFKMLQRCYFAKTSNADPFSNILNNVCDEIENLKTSLIREAQSGNSVLALSTAQKLQLTVETIYSSDTTFKQKLNAVYEFRNFARGSTLGPITRRAVDAFALTLIPFIFLAVLFAGIGAFPAYGVAFAISLCVIPVSTALLTLIDHKNDRRPTFFLKANDKRGKEITENLETLVRAEEEGKSLKLTDDITSSSSSSAASFTPNS